METCAICSKIKDTGEDGVEKAEGLGKDILKRVCSCCFSAKEFVKDKGEAVGE